MKPQTPQLVTVCIVAEAANIALARVLSYAWVKLRRPFTRQTVEHMLAIALRTAGSGPETTHWLCVSTLTEADAEHMLAFIATHGVPVVAFRVGPQEDTEASRDANRDTCLAAHGWEMAA
jgi:very-short-patch-repair endonuclease